MALDLGSNAAAKLEPFLLMSKSAKGAAAAKLIQDATSAPGVFVFAELLDMPTIQELAKSEQAPYHSLLQLFAYGTFEDYLKHKSTLPALNEAQLIKLKLLSLVSLSLERRILPYSLLLQTLNISTIRELEDLIIDGVYLDLLRGRLDQKAQQFEVEYAAGRDLAPGQLDALLTSLKAWSETTSTVLATLDEQMVVIRDTRMTLKANMAEHDKVVSTTVKELHERTRDRNAARKAMGGGDGMEIDEPKGFGKKTNPSSLRSALAGVSRKRNKF